ncbi:MAG: hypothetical protein COB51_02270 [Moraxellaceae bacterium]|nr:MAG: hypothetical protein COB51_02270 [Moraxellaceae bacterium]
MSVEQDLKQRCESKCELCAAEVENYSVYEVPPVKNLSADNCVLLCPICTAQISGDESLELNRWRCLGDSMWNIVPAVQVLSWRMLTRLSAESWAQELLEMLYLDDEVLEWAKSALFEVEDSSAIDCRDSNGAILTNGDSVTLIKDLVVKGANFTAKRGTQVKSISLTSNPEHIEGRVNGVRIVLVSAFLKKVNE